MRSKHILLFVTIFSLLVFGLFVRFNLTAPVIAQQIDTDMIAVPSASPPPVIWKVSASILNDNLTSQVTVQQFPSTTGVGFSFSLAQVADLPSRSAYVNGLADVGRLEGSLQSSMALNQTSNPTWHGISTQTPIEVYVKGNPGTPYFYQESHSAELRSTSSVFSGGGRSEAVFYNFTLPHTSLPNPYTYNANIPFTAGVTSGPIYNFPQYPGIPYCRVSSTGAVSSALGVNGVAVPTNLTASAQGFYGISVHIRTGVNPVAVAAGPYNGGTAPENLTEFMTINRLSTFVDKSYDPDNNQGTTPGAGILGWKWDITKPDGTVLQRVSNSNTLDYTPDMPGVYRIQLNIFDDEAMIALQVRNVTAVPVEPIIEQVSQISVPDSLGVKYVVKSSTGVISDLNGLEIRELLVTQGSGSCNFRKWCGGKGIGLGVIGSVKVPSPWTCWAATNGIQLAAGRSVFNIIDETITGQGQRKVFGDGHGTNLPGCSPDRFWCDDIGAMQSGEFIIRQVYEYRLPWTNGEWKTLKPSAYAGPHNITRQVVLVSDVSQPPFRWHMLIKKHGFTKDVSLHHENGVGRCTNTFQSSLSKLIFNNINLDDDLWPFGIE